MAIQQSINQLLFQGQLGAGFISNTPAYQELRGSKSREQFKIQPAQQTAEQYMAEDLEKVLKEIEGGRQMTPTGKRESETKQYLEDRYRNISGAKFQMERAIRDYPALAEKYNPYIKEYGLELKRIQGIQESKGYKYKGRKQAKKTMAEKTENTNMTKETKQMLEGGSN